MEKTIQCYCTEISVYIPNASLQPKSWDSVHPKHHPDIRSHSWPGDSCATFNTLGLHTAALMPSTSMLHKHSSQNIWHESVPGQADHLHDLTAIHMHASSTCMPHPALLISEQNTREP